MKNNENSIKEECADLKDTELKVDWKEKLAMSIWIAMAFGVAIGGGKYIFGFSLDQILYLIGIEILQ